MSKIILFSSLIKTVHSEHFRNYKSGYLQHKTANTYPNPKSIEALFNWALTVILPDTTTISCTSTAVI